MLVIRGTQDIFISRGDTFALGVDLIEKTDEGYDDYDLADREYLIFKIWEKGFCKVVTHLKSELGTSIINIGAETTKNLCGGYVYSIDLMYADGTKETVVGQSPSTAPKFVVLEA